jgi:hypothetical protein
MGKMANQLSKRGFKAYDSTIAKIEAGDRSVSIDEAAVIADIFEISLDSLLGRKGMEDNQSHALSVLSDEAKKLLPELMEMRDRLRRAYQDLAAQWDFQAFDTFVADGATWGWDGLSLEHKRALLIWAARDLVMEQLGQAITGLAGISAIRSATPLELNEHIKVIEAAAKKQEMEQ